MYMYPVVIQGLYQSGIGQYVFDDGENMSFFSWDAEESQPQHRFVTEIVIAKQYPYDQHSWHDYYTYSSLNVICEFR